VKNDKELLINY